MRDMRLSLMEAWKLVVSFDEETYGIIGLTLCITILSTVLSAVISMPLGVLAGSMEFYGKRLIMRVVNTMMGLPPVVAGLVVYMILSSKGPLGDLKLLFTPVAMIIAQVVIISPILIGLTAAAVTLKSSAVQETCAGLGLSRWKTLLLLVQESKTPIISALLAGYGRAVSEVGAVMLVGGNIRYETRVITTSIVLETGKGNYAGALALGIILLLISFLVNWLLQGLQEGK